jgi:GNAT superfamily N-acetyltransferase
LKITVKELKPQLWPDLERLFGEKGACGGCWCMYWRQEKGEAWDKLKGAKNKKRFKDLVMQNELHGAIAYDGDTPVGWINFDRRTDFAKLNRAPSFKCDDAETVWSIPCFYIKVGWRGKGVATELLNFAVKKLQQSKAQVIEAYPVKVKNNRAPGAFIWTGTVSLFKKAGFKPVGKTDGGKQRMRLS